MKPTTTTLAAAALLAAASQAHATPITWSFIETSCTPVYGGRPCAPFIAPLATLILPDTTSTGSASWQGSPISIPVPKLTGDTDFSFIPSEGNPITPPTYGTQLLCSIAFTPSAICNYYISWDEVAGQLLGVKIDYLTASIAELHLGLMGGRIASDYTIGGCPTLGTCNVTGSWQDTMAVSEPSTISLLALGLFWAIFWASSVRVHQRLINRPDQDPVL